MTDTKTAGGSKESPKSTTSTSSVKKTDDQAAIIAELTRKLEALEAKVANTGGAGSTVDEVTDPFANYNMNKPYTALPINEELTDSITLEEAGEYVEKNDESQVQKGYELLSFTIRGEAGNAYLNLAYGNGKKAIVKYEV
jgi:inorganic pyrophosphatase/exopolyphosphatase